MKLFPLRFLFLLSIIIYSSCSNTERSQKDTSLESPTQPDPNQVFDQEMSSLKEYFNIPGLSILVKKDTQVIYQDFKGWADIETQKAVSATTLFPIASPTKTFSTVLLMKLVEAGKLSLDDPMSKYIDNPKIDPQIKVKHVLSHTSQGSKIGEKYYYSFRFSLLTKVIEKASDKFFEALMQEQIFQPLNLSNTYLLEDSTQIIDNQLEVASPYMMDEELQKGFIDFGFSASAGIISTAEDLAIFDNALNNNTLISQESKELMFSSFQENLPYGYGIFSQEFEGQQLVWVYGQYDCYGSLILKVPEKQLTLIILANSNLMSDAPRLLYGDVTTSLFALSFLKNYVFEYQDMPLFETDSTLAQNSFSNTFFYRKKLGAQALAASFMARFDTDEMQVSARILDKLFELYPDYEAYADMTLMHNLAFLKSVAFYKELGEWNKFDAQLEKIGALLYQKDPEDPYLNIYLGTYYDRANDLDKARPYYQQIVNTPNFSRSWYTNEATLWLKDH